MFDYLILVSCFTTLGAIIGIWFMLDALCTKYAGNK